MDANDYQKQAMRTLNPAIGKDEILLNAVMGLCGESGEAIDLVKKSRFQGHPLDAEHLEKELGDVAWYLAEAATALGVDLSSVLEANIAKLKARYPQGFESEESLHRAAKDI